MRILVTGSSGMVGRAFVDDPRSSRYELLTPGRRDLDLRDQTACRRYLSDAKPDMIIHLAAVVGGIQANIDEPVRFFADNMAISLNLITAANDAGIPNFLNMASSCMYPKDLGRPMKEADLLTGPLEPTNEGYALAKIASWKLCQYITRSVPHRYYKTLIPCNLYGPHDTFDSKHSHLVAAAILKIDQAVRDQQPTVTIWGNGEARREFLFVEDLVDFIGFAIENIDRLPIEMNVGVGSDNSVNDYYDAVATAMNYKGAFVHDLTKPVGMRAKLLDVSKQHGLQWQPATALEAGVRRTVAYYHKMRDLQVSRPVARSPAS